MESEIFNCEINYYSCFATIENLGTHIEFRNPLVPDRHDQNMSVYQVGNLSEQQLKKLILNDFKKVKMEEKNFVKCS